MMLFIMSAQILKEPLGRGLCQGVCAKLFADSSWMKSASNRGVIQCRLLVLTERKTRKEIIIPLRDKTSASVVRALNGIEHKVGALFPNIFASITVDNGCEFADAAGMEKKRRGKGKRTEIYYCHPYTPSEAATRTRTASSGGTSRRAPT